MSYTETNDQCSVRKERYYSIDGDICMKTADSADLRDLFIAEPVDAPRTAPCVDSYLAWPGILARRCPRLHVVDRFFTISPFASENKVRLISTMI